MGCNEETEEKYKLALEVDPNDADIHSDYGKLLYEMGRNEEAEEQFKLSLKSDPNNVYYLYDYGLLLFNMERIEESEEQFKRAIRLSPSIPDSHIAYSILLLFKELEEDAIEEMKEASRAFREKGDEIREHLVLAWLYEKLADIYYLSIKYQESGQYAEMAGNEFIEASKQAGEDFKRTSLTKGYTLKGRAEIRKLDLPDLQPPYNIKMCTKVMKGIYHASEYYKKAAEVSPEENQICNACSLSMRCLSEMLDNMLLLVEPEPKKTPEIKTEVEKWREELANCEKIYKENEKGKNFIQSLSKLMACLDNLARYKESTMLMEKITLEDCIGELIGISNRIEGPLQKIINDSATQIEQCKDKIIPYKGIETKLCSVINETQKLESMQCIEPIIEINSSFKPKKSAILKWIYEYRKIVAISMLFCILVGLFSVISKNNLISPILTKYIPTKDNSYIFLIGLSAFTFLFGPAIVPRVWAKFKRKD
ncbi:tetratricopeptide repeat protein [Methanosarcina barkeri]|uniref:TPR repeat-containing protein n=1 Tax=Methanosarcina barkeri CM1 TaxID=796385 RepID=A0A0G3C7N2_METBA|nr:tetratricopeptide repeat protein [Methanosarcina barkeri]AKJ38014.1 TPR repeat-containing protein [Methanosarcina barkeri CM1]